MADAFAGLEISAQEWLDSERRDPESELSHLLRRIADEVADAERGFLTPHTHTGATLASIHVTEEHDSDGFIEEHVNSARLVTNVANARAGYIRNRHSKNVKRRFSKGDTVRPAFPFAREALDAVTRIEGV